MTETTGATGPTGTTDATGATGRGLLVIGDVVTDIVARHDTPLAPATDTAARITTLPGGAGANVACWAARTGAEDVRLLACVGADTADWHREALLRAGVRPHLRIHPDAPTAVVISLVDPTAERTLVTDSGASLRLSPADWQDTGLDGIAHLHLSGYLFFSGTGREVARAAMRAARTRGVPVSVDPASAGFIEGLGADRLLESIAEADLIAPNRAEAELLTGLTEPREAAVKLSQRFPLVALKLGGEGALLASAGTVLAHVPASPTRPRDTTGAGDAFLGAFLASRLAGASPAEATAAGCRAGAEAVTVIGGRPGPDRHRRRSDLRT
ncbi:carbohydrate kinase family protein [Streptomyces sp. 8N706]|uniref:carbohydrate kinase family protein n=1 Tax=Streptomyces sp. 8N706 TaxID=3457416 RepID=UPI003FD4AE6F